MYSSPVSSPIDLIDCTSIDFVICSGFEEQLSLAVPPVSTPCQGSTDELDEARAGRTKCVQLAEAQTGRAKESADREAQPGEAG